MTNHVVYTSNDFIAMFIAVIVTFIFFYGIFKLADIITNFSCKKRDRKLRAKYPIVFANLDEYDKLFMNKERDIYDNALRTLCKKIRNEREQLPLSLTSERPMLEEKIQKMEEEANELRENLKPYDVALEECLKKVQESIKATNDKKFITEFHGWLREELD